MRSWLVTFQLVELVDERSQAVARGVAREADETHTELFPAAVRDDIGIG